MTIMSEEKVKLLGIHIDNRLNFHISQLCKKTGKKLNAVTWVFKYMDISQRNLIANTFIMFQFSYCSCNFSLSNRNVWQYNYFKKLDEIIMGSFTIHNLQLKWFGNPFIYLYHIYPSHRLVAFKKL